MTALYRKLASEEELREQLRELEAEQGSAWNVGAVDSTRYVSPTSLCFPFCRFPCSVKICQLPSLVASQV